MFRRITLLLTLLIATGLVGPSASDVQACPMCKEAAGNDDRLPQAFQASILFMLAMPALLFTGMGVGLYKMAKRENEMLEALEQYDPSMPVES